jgi:uncharacterized protein (TIGR03083 family)
MSPGEIYADTRLRITELVRSLSPEEVVAPAPATPGWSTHSIVSHLAGLAADFVNGEVEGAGSDPWTARQVAERQGRTIDQLLDEWSVAAPKMEAVIDDLPVLPRTRVVTDVATHEQDIRGGVRRPGGLDSAGFDFGLQSFVMGVDYRVKKLGLPALTLKAGDQEWTVGEGEPEASVTASPYELFRAMAGRRSAAQVTAYAWEGGAERFLPAFMFFGPLPTADVLEL